uniref:Uncharacterized protein n=1 Tax=Rhizophora mucronata TaxID=61149 RepID=A0A2P2PSI9_RHIMU
MLAACENACLLFMLMYFHVKNLLSCHFLNKHGYYCIKLIFVITNLWNLNEPASIFCGAVGV